MGMGPLETDFKDPPWYSFKHMVFIQAEARGSFLLTGSSALGVFLAIDHDGQIYDYGLYNTNSIGGGLVVGVSGGINAGIAITDPERFEDWGFNAGFTLSYGLLGLNPEINIYPEELTDIFQAGGRSFYETFIVNKDFGYTSDVVGIGLDFGAYFDFSKTSILKSYSNFNGLLNDIDGYLESNGIELSDEQINSFKLNVLNIYLNYESNNKMCKDDSETCY